MTDDLCRAQEMTAHGGRTYLLECAEPAGHQSQHAALLEVGSQSVVVRWTSEQG